MNELPLASACTAVSHMLSCIVQPLRTCSSKQSVQAIRASNSCKQKVMDEHECVRAARRARARRKRFRRSRGCWHMQVRALQRHRVPAACQRQGEWRLARALTSYDTKSTTLLSCVTACRIMPHATPARTRHTQHSASCMIVCRTQRHRTQKPQAER